MKLRRIAIHSLEGIDDPFVLDELDAGFHIIHGPNGIGKSSLCRTLRALLWAEPQPRISASADFEHNSEVWRVEREGTRIRWRREQEECAAPPLPEPHLADCYFLTLRDLIDLRREAGDDVASEIRRQMAGGFDLEKTRDESFKEISGRFGSQEHSRFEDAKREVQRAEKHHEGIRREAQELDSLEIAKGEALAAVSRCERIRLAITIRDQEEELAGVEEKLAVFSEAMGKLTGNELRQLDHLEEKAVELRGKRREREDDLAENARKRRDAGLEQRLDPVRIATERERAQNLVESARQLDDARAERDDAHARVESTRARCCGGGVDVEFDVNQSAALFSFLRDASALDIKEQEIRERLRLLGSLDSHEADERRLDSLRQAVSSLRRWLRAPDPAVQSDRTKSRMLKFLALSLPIAALGTGSYLLAQLDSYAGWWVILLGAAGLLQHFRSAVLQPEIEAQRRSARVEFPNEIEEPARWNLDAVGTRLRECENEFSKLEAARERARDRDVERKSHESQLEMLSERRSNIQDRREAIASQLGVDEIPRDAELVDLADAIAHFRHAHALAAGADARVARFEETRQNELEALREFLRPYFDEEVPDPSRARNAVQELIDRDASFAHCLENERRIRAELEGLDRDQADNENQVGSLYREAGLEPGDRMGLASRVEDLEVYRKLREKRATFRHTIDRDLAQLEVYGEAGLAEETRAALDAELQAQKERANSLGDLTGRIGQIRANIATVSRGHDLEAKIAHRESALDKLRAKRDGAMASAAGRFLMDQVIREHESTQLPQIMERARALFSSFTHAAYELQIASAKDASFVALDVATGERLRPDQLSDGTRVQLLLAARLAFAEEAERESRMPLFLDEALDQSDPIRFDAVIQSLARMIEEEGRQIFYLTSDPTDAVRIQNALRDAGASPAHEIDLAEVRKRAAQVDWNKVTVEATPTIPAADGMSPEAYAKLLGVGWNDPRRGHQGQHLFHVCWDDLVLLHELLERHIENVGRWLMHVRNGSGYSQQVIARGGVGSELPDRIELLEVFCAAWSEGRGRPIDTHDLAECGHISDRYLEHVQAIAREQNGDAAALLEIVTRRSDERVKGYYAKQAEDLRAFLDDQGFIDPRARLDGEAIRARVMQSPAASRLPARIVTQCVDRWLPLSEDPVDD